MPPQTEEFKSAQSRISKQLRENRPTITDSTIKSYTSLLSNMYYREYARDVPLDMSFFTDEKRIMALLENKPPTTRKTYLAAIVVLNGAKHKNTLIEKQMKDDSIESERIASTQTKTETQNINWVDYDTIKQLQAMYESEAMKILNMKTRILTETEKHLITQYMILTLSSGIYFPPRRSEMIYIQVKNPDPETDNYIDMKNDEFVYNRYKTSKTYGRQTVRFGGLFKSILKKYLGKIDGQTFLLERNGKPYTANYITRELNNIFGKNISTSLLRHIYLSNIYKDIPKLDQMKQTAREMGHDLNMALEYVKH